MMPVINISVTVNCDTTSVLRNSIPLLFDLNEPFNIPAGLKAERMMAGYMPERIPKKRVMPARKSISKGDEKREMFLPVSW